MESKSLLDTIPIGAEPVILASKNGVEIVIFRYEGRYYIMKETATFGFAGEIPAEVIGRLKESLCRYRL